MAAADIKIEDAVFPYLIAERGRKVSSFISVRRTTLDTGDSQLFYIAGADLQQRDNRGAGGMPETVVRLQHSFARDEEADPAYIADFTFKGLAPISTAGYRILYAGYLTSVRFYPLSDQDPFLDAQRQDESKDHYANAGYPYLPGHVDFGKALELPLEVEVALHYNVHRANRYLRESMQAAHERRIERERKRLARIAEEEARRAQARAEREAWLLTEAGRDYSAARAVSGPLNAVSQGYDPAQAESAEEIHAVVSVVHASLTPDQRVRLTRQIQAGGVIDGLTSARACMRPRWRALKALLLAEPTDT